MIIKSKNKIIPTILACFILLVGALVWEYVIQDDSPEHLVNDFEQHLHLQEKKADAILNELADSTKLNQLSQDKELIIVGLEEGKLFFWTEEIVGMSGLYDIVPSGKKFVEINHSYYEVRQKVYGDIHYIALLHIKDNYPYTNKYIRNTFGKYLKIKKENVDNIEVSPEKLEGGSVIHSKEGMPLFYIRFNEGYKDRSVNYFLLVIYIIFFILLFYVYGQILSNIKSMRFQVIFVIVVSLFLILLHQFMYHFRMPDTIYRLRIFEPSRNPDVVVVSVGDLLISVFVVVQMLYVTIKNLKISYSARIMKRYRYVHLSIALLLCYFYILLFIYIIHSLIHSGDIYLNIARLLEIDGVSIVAFVAIIIGGLGVVILEDGVVSIFRNLIPLKKILLMGAVIALVLGFIALLLKMDIFLQGVLFVLAVLGLVLLNCTVKKREVQRSIYLLIMFLLSVFIVMVEKHYEKEREFEQRKSFAWELINERDYNFEVKLTEIDRAILESDTIRNMIRNYEEQRLKDYLHSDFLDMTGYNYKTTILICDSYDLLDVGNEYNCHEYFNRLIFRLGIKIGESNFYNLDDFDGMNSYIGKFVCDDIYLILRFDSANESEGKGYPQILSKQSIEGADITYPYSYAKYKDGHLVRSSGLFNYYKTLDGLGNYDMKLTVGERDGYTHMYFPVDRKSGLVLSLNSQFFSIYSLNILYVFFLCILFSSYGIFFNLNTGVNFRKNTLKGRIKNSILGLVFTLFIILTFFSIAFTTKSYERRHYLKVIELLKYINKELEKQPCVEYMQCPEIYDILVDWSEMMSIDINIYSSQGRLIATSRPEIFQNGFVGYLVDPAAYDRIIKERGTSFVKKKNIGDLTYMSAYMPLLLSNNNLYIINVPYFTENDEMNQNIFILVIVVMNIAAVMMVIAFILSSIIADRVTKPLQMVNSKLKRMRLGGKNEKIEYEYSDEVGELVKEYNNMVEKLERNVKQLARSERESAWREMARQIAHEIKNPLTPMKLNIQFMQRSLQIRDPEEFKARFSEISETLIEQIDNMASIASLFSDFAKISDTKIEHVDISELLLSTIKLFENNADSMEYEIEPGILISGDKSQIQRLFVNIIKNAIQSVPEGKESKIIINLRKIKNKVKITVKDNGSGIPIEIQEKIFEPNFTTKSKGTGLGLAISKNIVQNHGGKLDFISNDNGTEFVIILYVLE